MNKTRKSEQRESSTMVISVPDREKSKDGMEKFFNEKSSESHNTALSEMQEGLNPQYLMSQ